MSHLTPYQNSIFLSRYANYKAESERREGFAEAIYDRFQGFWLSEPCGQIPAVRATLQEFCEYMYDLHVMPSMRSFMTAGPALKRDHMMAYNCCCIAISSPVALVEVMKVLMCGTGVGFVVEEKYTSQLPCIPDKLRVVEFTLEVEDSREGWAHAYSELLNHLYQGLIPNWDLSLLRPNGAPLMTTGGTSSGPEPLHSLFEFVVSSFKTAVGRKFTPMEVHDLVCKTEEIVVVGGVRRSAGISLSDRYNIEIRDCKNYLFSPNPEGKLQPKFRALANNSTVYYGRPSHEEFWADWEALRSSGSGERGFFNVTAAREKASTFRNRKGCLIIGTNPCAETFLRDKGLCNLSEVVVQPGDSIAELMKKVRLATFIGTLQSTLTNFPGMRPEWRQNQEEERLLGVSLTGIAAHPILSGGEGEWLLRGYLTTLRKVAEDENTKWAEILGIPESKAVCVIKPSGTVSALCGVSSGIHAWWAPFYERRIEMANRDPMCHQMKQAGIPWECKQIDPENSTIFVFPTKAPKGAEVQDDLSAIEQLARVRAYEECWAHQKVSCTIFVKGHEWDKVGEYMWDNFDTIPGVSFFPADDNPEDTKSKYIQPPYTTVTEAQYLELLAKMPDSIDWDFREDGRHASEGHEPACAGGACAFS